MGPQGNLLRLESLVLVVTIDEPNANLNWWETQICVNIERHIEMRFNKERFARKPTVDLLDLNEETLASARRKKEKLTGFVGQFVKVAVIENDSAPLSMVGHVGDAVRKKLTDHPCVLLVLRREANSPRNETAKDEHKFVIEIEKAVPVPCAVEFFHVQPERQQATPDQDNISPDRKGRAESANDLYHLASRVCGAFTEYRIKYTNDPAITPIGLKAVQRRFFFQENEGGGFASVSRCDSCSYERIDCPSVCPFDLTQNAGIAEELVKKQQVVEDRTAVPKILDIRDAVALLCEGLDGSEKFFPPVPRGLQDIFAGTNNDTPTVAARYKFPFGVWFRGQSRVCHDVVPSLYHESQWHAVHRGCKKQICEKTMYDEATMVHHFMSHKPLLRHDYIDHFEWLCLMQHHGAPTRVLDWSESVMIALYFAVCDPTADCDGVVWALNAGRLNEITRVSKAHRYACFSGSTDVILRSAMAVSRTGPELRRTLEKIGKLDEVMNAVNDPCFWMWTNGAPTSRESLTWHKLSAPVAVFPTRVNPREEDQLATFTICGGKQYDAEVTCIKEGEKFPPPLGLVELSRWRQNLPEQNIEEDWDALSETWLPKGKPFLQAFLVPSCAKRKLREQLKRLGVHVGSLFPELEHQSKYIRHQWRFEHQ